MMPPQSGIKCRPQDAPIQELRALRDTIISSVEHSDYPSSGLFAATAHGVVGGYMLGKKIPATKRNRSKLISRITEDAKPKNSGTAKAWCRWNQRLNESAKASRLTTPVRDRSWLPSFLQRAEFEIDQEFRVLTTDGDQGLTLIGPRLMIVKAFQHQDELTALGLGLIDVANKISIEAGSVEPTDLDESAADQAIARWIHLFKHGISNDDCECDP